MDNLTAREDQHGHAHLEAMEDAVPGAAAGQKDSVKRFVEHGQEYIALLMKYIENEEDWLFPQANRALDEAKQQVVGQRLQRDDREDRCGGRREQYVEIANLLADRFDVSRAELLEE
jgi:hemerythrin-like domain-containing protein